MVLLVRHVVCVCSSQAGEGESASGTSCLFMECDFCPGLDGADSDTRMVDWSADTGVAVRRKQTLQNGVQKANPTVALTGFYRSPPRRPVSAAPVDTSGRAVDAEECVSAHTYTHRDENEEQSKRES